jgi:asparagine synthase (glutamine-hydrolysing)
MESPCYVAFSGGRDSSAVLAIATAVARREGLPDPVPITEFYPEVAETDESDWQRMVIDHLGLSEWLRFPITSENDLIGSGARQGLLRDGLVWPAPLQAKNGLFARLDPGSLLTGEGGDEVFGFRRVAALRRLARERRHPRPITWRLAAEAVLPYPIRRRRAVTSFRRGALQPWLRPGVAEQHHRMLADDQASEPLRWDLSLHWLRRRRGSVLAARNHRALAARYGIRLVEPFLTEEFVSAVAIMGNAFGYTSRAEIMDLLFGDVLPAAVVQRRSKAIFNRAVFSTTTRDFAQQWNGEGVDPGAVDPDVLRAEWLSDRPSALSALLLQSAWLAGQASAVDRRVAR